MDIVLEQVEIRVLGCLMEKEMATPEYYPLSLNALVNACNQKSNRDPVVNYDEAVVSRAINNLKDKKLVWRSDAGRVAKYNENFVKIHNLLRKEAALLCLLFLRGPQTLGELRGRSERLYKFSDLREVEETLDSLAEMNFAVKLPRQPGRKESRFAHLLADVPSDGEWSEEQNSQPLAQEEAHEAGEVARLEGEVRLLRQELAALREEFLSFKKQFD